MEDRPEAEAEGKRIEEEGSVCGFQGTDSVPSKGIHSIKRICKLLYSLRILAVQQFFVCFCRSHFT